MQCNKIINVNVVNVCASLGKVEKAIAVLITSLKVEL
jgi:hypothetical protein